MHLGVLGVGTICATGKNRGCAGGKGVEEGRMAAVAGIAGTIQATYAGFNCTYVFEGWVGKWVF